MDRGKKILSAIGLPAVLLAFAFLVALAAVLVRSPEKESDPLVPLDLWRADTDKSSGEAGARSVIGDPDKRSPDAASPGEKVPAGGRSDGGAPGSGPAAETREGKIARLIRGLGAETPEARRFAAEELSEMEPKPREAIQALSAALEDPDDEVRRFALNALAAVAAEAPEAIPAIRAALTNRVPSVQYAAAKALLKLGARPEEVLPALVDAVRKERWTFRHFAVDLLGSLGPAAAEAVPLLLILLEEREDNVPRSAAGALSAIWGEDFPAKVASLEFESGSARMAVLRPLKKYGPKAAAAMPLLARVLDSRDSELLQEATRILLAIRGASDETLGILVRAMEKAP
ncbi:MAG: HEAT repeat domain-containing protein, partial [Planctomycetes bacterium]|nr:HEAT repeat domain-containing protein [Planctomycetota bacterium]